MCSRNYVANGSRFEIPRPRHGCEFTGTLLRNLFVHNIVTSPLQGSARKTLLYSTSLPAFQSIAQLNFPNGGYVTTSQIYAPDENQVEEQLTVVSTLR